jgi:hypothetical protein
MSSSEEPPAPSSRVHVSEDWAATFVGLLLIVLIITGVITKGVLQ